MVLSPSMVMVIGLALPVASPDQPANCQQSSGTASSATSRPQVKLSDHGSACIVPLTVTDPLPVPVRERE